MLETALAASALACSLAPAAGPTGMGISVRALPAAVQNFSPLIPPRGGANSFVETAPRDAVHMLVPLAHPDIHLSP